MSLQADMAALGIEEHSFHVGKGFTKLFQMPAGTTIGQHAHDTAHDSVLLIGRVIVRRGGHEIEMQAPAVVPMPAHLPHSIEALTPALWACNWPTGL